MHRCSLKLVLTLASAAVLTIGQSALAQEPYQPPCESAPFTNFDFWVGDWVAFDVNTGVVQGVDRVEKINDGCTILQEWSQLTDRYRIPDSPLRYSGVSFNSLTPAGWQQVWVGSGGGTVTLTGGLDENGTMILNTPEATAQTGQVFKRTWYWDPQEDGTIHSWGEIRTKNEDGSWSEPTIPWDLRYLPRGDAPNLIAAPQNEN